MFPSVPAGMASRHPCVSDPEPHKKLDGFIRARYQREGEVKLRGPFEMASRHPCVLVFAEARFPAKREQTKRLSGLLPESRGQNLALTVFCVPCSLDSGMVRVRSNAPATVLSMWLDFIGARFYRGWIL